MKYKTQPMLVQRKSLEFMLRTRPGVGLINDMGLGKTMTAIYWAMKLGLKRVAVVGRLDDLDTWSDEIPAHSDRTFYNVCGTKSSKKYRRARLAKALSIGPMFYLMTYDSVKQLEPQLRRVEWDGVIVDEITEIKHGSKRTKAVLRVFGQVPHRVGMTGTMVTNSPEDVFYQMQFIDGGQRFGTNFWAFRKRYFWPEPQGHRWHLFPENLARIRKKIFEVCIRFKKEDALDLPPKVFLRRPCRMTPQQQERYDRLRREFELELNDGRIIELQYIVQQFTKMLQVVGGFYYTDEGTENLPCGKLDELRWMLDLPEFRETKKIVIWAAFNHELELIRDTAVKLGYHGTMFWKWTPDRKAARQRFAQDPDCQMFIGQVASGIGINELKVSDTVFYYSRSLKLAHRLQSIDRTHRKGSEIHKSIRYIDMVVPGTVDARVYSMLQKYKDVADQIMDGRTALEWMRG